MKKLWNIIAVFAVANLVAVGGLVGWLRMSGRLNWDRARTVREMLTPTLASDAAKAADAVAKADAEKKAAEEAIKAGRPPLTAAEKLAARVEATELDRQRMERLRREVQDLQAVLARERSELESQRAQFGQDQKTFDEQVRQVGEVARSEQFQKTLGVLQTMKPAAVKSLLMEVMQMGAPQIASQPEFAQPGMTANGSASIEAVPAVDAASAGVMGGGMRVAVEYLNSMEERARTKVMAEFAKSDPRLAAELLESLRLRGQFARADAGSN
jgi:small-conductance mechanosensitive channel